MLKKINRLCREKDFKQVFKTGYSSFDNLTGIKAVRNDLGINRIGIIVGTKISKKAVDRNKIKRRLRAALKENLSNLKIGYDMAIITLPPIMKADFTSVKESVERNLRRLRLVK